MLFFNVTAAIYLTIFTTLYTKDAQSFENNLQEEWEMTKRMCVVTAVAVLAVLVGFATSSEAAVMKFDYFSIDVPNGWKVDDDKEAFTVSFIAPDDSAALTIAIFKNEGLPLEDYAKLFQNELDGKNLQESGGAYQFSFSPEDGVDSKGIVSGDDEMIMFMTITGEHKDLGDMLRSFEEI